MKGKAKLTAKILALSEVELRAWAREEWSLAFPPEMGHQDVIGVLKDKGEHDRYRIDPDGAPQGPAPTSGGAAAAQQASATADPAPAPQAQPDAPTQSKGAFIPAPELITGPTDQPKMPEPSAPTAQLAKAPIAPAAQAAAGLTAGGKPVHPRYAKLKTQPIGRKVAREQYFTPDGLPLPEDTNPVLTVEQWNLERLRVDPDLRYNLAAGIREPLTMTRADGITQLGPNALRMHGPAKKLRMFRHPPHTRYFFNPLTNAFLQPTEMLMQNEDLVPVFDEPVLDVEQAWVT